MKKQTEQQQATDIKEVYAGAVAVERIEVVSNARKRFDPSEMGELIKSVEHSGVLVPVLLSPGSKEGFYRLIAGERRLRAARSVGLTTIPARVIEAPPEKLEEISVLENLHRVDLGPIEEARAFRRLLDSGRNVEDLSGRVDKSVKYIYRAVRLLDLPKTAIKAIEKGTLSPEHGHQILRLPEAQREKLVLWAITPGWGGDTPTLHALKREIGQRLERDLARARFPKDREYAGALACTNCPFNTGNQSMLFDGAEEGKCTNGACFTKKTNLFLSEFKEKAGKRFAGLEFAGTGQEDYNGRVKGAWVLKPEETKSPKIMALMAKNPDKFGFAVLKPSTYGAKTMPTAVLVCKDKDLMEAKIRKVPMNGQHTMTPEEQARDRFLDACEVKALFAEAANALTEARKEHLVYIVGALRGNSAAYEAMGVGAANEEDASYDGASKIALAALTEKNLLRLAWLCSLDAYNDDGMNTDLKSLGLSGPKIRKEARAKGLTEWEALQAQAAQAKKKEEEAVR